MSNEKVPDQKFNFEAATQKLREGIERFKNFFVRNENDNTNEEPDASRRAFLVGAPAAIGTVKLSSLTPKGAEKIITPKHVETLMRLISNRGTDVRAVAYTLSPNWKTRKILKNKVPSFLKRFCA